jgi:hypothetical protein
MSIVSCMCSDSILLRFHITLWLLTLAIFLLVLPLISGYICGDYIYIYIYLLPGPLYSLPNQKMRIIFSFDATFLSDFVAYLWTYIYVCLSSPKEETCLNFQSSHFWKIASSPPFPTIIYDAFLRNVKRQDNFF